MGRWQHTWLYWEKRIKKEVFEKLTLGSCGRQDFLDLLKSFNQQIGNKTNYQAHQQLRKDDW